mmetsp:Transcript_1932/g.3663  ORF Transcript_1932/g.3663 Transcript_1932/m.3663 type:complete len:858 (+) Transcript_1932:76-2649(+)
MSAEEAAAAGAKDTKDEGKAAAEIETPKEPEKPKELEEDAPDAGRKGLAKADAAAFLPEDSSLNALVTADGRMLTSLCDRGMQYLVAGARASVGLKSGRYMFEVKIIEYKNPAEPAGAKAPSPKPRNLLRVGFASNEASVILPDLAESVCFDSEGNLYSGKERKKVAQKFGHGQVAAVVLNLDAASPNANTISLFVNGSRVCEPQPLPPSLVGKPLYPAVAYRNISLQVNFGPCVLRPLPFKCHTVNNAVLNDCHVKKPALPESGKYEVVFPIGVPDEATFDWLDQFLGSNKNYVELSDRAVLDWASKSGIQRPKGYSWRTNNDKPDMGFGLQHLDDCSVTEVMAEAAPATERNFVVMAVKGNLVAEDRKAALARFAGNGFTKVAKVIMGESTAEYKAWIQEQMLASKQLRAEAEARKKKAELARKKLEEERKKKAEAAKKAREAKEKKGKGDDAEAKAEDEMEAEAAADEEEDEEVAVQPVSLTEAEKALSFRKKDVPDLSTKEMSLSFAKFSLPSTEEGFDRIDFEWLPEDKSKEYLREFVTAKKLTERVEDLQPSEWFATRWAEWKKLLTSWKKKQQEFKDPAAKKRAAAAKEKKDGEEAAEGNAEDKPAKMDINAEDLDVFSVEDVMDIGTGEPLFAKYAYEDWALLTLRFELHLLIHAFRHDLGDPERAAFHESHLSFYYNKYYKMPFKVKNFGVEKLEDLIDMVKDTAEISGKNCLEAQLSDDTPMDNFVKLTEDHRRDRLRRLDAGDETAQLKFARPAPSAPVSQKSLGTQQHSSWRTGQNSSAAARDNKRPPSPGRGSYGGSYGGSRAPAPRTSYGGYGGYAGSSRYYGGGGRGEYGNGGYGGIGGYRR